MMPPEPGPLAEWIAGPSTWATSIAGAAQVGGSAYGRKIEGATGEVSRMAISQHREFLTAPAHHTSINQSE